MKIILPNSIDEIHPRQDKTRRSTDNRWKEVAKRTMNKVFSLVEGKEEKKTE